MIHALKYFRISLRIRRNINEYVLNLPYAELSSISFFTEFVYTVCTRIIKMTQHSINCRNFGATL
jgi:hypothetical protein